MEARFVILHPDDTGEILQSTTLIRCLKSQVDGALVYSVVKESNRWLLEDNPFLEEIFCYREDPKELLDQLKDFLPDYLIDLDGSRRVRRFKNRLKVLDFTIDRRNISDRWTERAFSACRLFDVEDDGKGMQLETSSVYKDLLPGNFLDGYLVLSLDTSILQRQMTDEQIIEIAVMIEKPMVVTGSAKDRNLADRIGQSTGCAVFPTCGDLTMPEIASVVGHSSCAIVFDPFWSLVARAVGIKNLEVNRITDPAGLKEIVLWARSNYKADHDRITV
ncbi:MAG: hypothetical protein WC699_04110 [Bacteroidales bacterium]